MGPGPDELADAPAHDEARFGVDEQLGLDGIELSVRADVSRADMVLAYLVKQAGMSLLSRASQVSSTAETRLPSG